MLLRLQNSYHSMSGNMRELDRIANNLANSNTIGFRRSRFFTEVLNEQLDAEGSPVSTRSINQWNDQTTAELKPTDNPLDVAIDGDGFFVLSDPESGEFAYTRAGQFMLDEEGTIRTPQGKTVEGATGPIDVPPEGGAIDIRKNGDVLVDGELVGTLRVVQFENPEMLANQDGATFLAGDQIPEDVEDPSVVQGHLEMSNVDVIEAMAALINQSRMFELQQRTLRTVDQYLQRTSRDLARF